MFKINREIGPPVDKIIELIDMSVRRESNVKLYLEQYVEKELF